MGFLTGKMDSLVGMIEGSFYKSPGWTDQSKPPGHSSQASETGYPGWWHGYISGENIVFGAFGTYLIVALLIYVLFPYDFEAASKGWALSWILPRVVLNVVLQMAWNGWWHVTLFGLGWGKRPYKPNRQYNVAQLLHNMWYTFLAILHWTALEIAFVYMFATGRLPYVTNEEFLSCGWGTLTTILVFIASPMWVELHFYFMHRMEHLKPVYKYCHSLHHRSQDVEPFAGMCMHPIESMYYFSSVCIAVMLRTHPFIMLWIGMLAALYPAGSHSGFEDCFASDQFHHIHHMYFEGNYGSPSPPFDKMFGTFRDKMYYKENSENTVACTNAKARLGAPESWDHLAYWIGTITMFGTLFKAAASSTGDISEVSLAVKVAWLVTAGPFIWGTLLLTLSSNTKQLSRKMFLPAMFDKEFIVGQLGVHLICGTLAALVPIYFTVTTLLLPPGLGLVSSFYQ